MALWRYYALDQRDRASVDDFAVLADVWQQIREMEEIAARERRLEFFDAWKDQKPQIVPVETWKDPSPVCAPVRDDSEEDREPVSESDTADEELDPHPIDELAAPDGKKYTGYGATFKNATRTRLLALRAQGLTTGKIMAAAGGALGYGELMDIIEGNKVRIDVYESLAGILDEIEAAAGSGDPALRGEVQG